MSDYEKEYQAEYGKRMFLQNELKKAEAERDEWKRRFSEAQRCIEKIESELNLMTDHFWNLVERRIEDV
jgi:hypothetical protein